MNVRFFTFVLAVLLTACGTGTTPAGPVGDVVDVRSHLTPDVAGKAPTDENATRHEVPVDVHGMPARVVWHTFEHEGAKYVLSYRWELLQEKKGFRLLPLGHQNLTKISAEAVEKLRLRVGFQDVSGAILTIRGNLSVDIDAKGVGGPT